MYYNIRDRIGEVLHGEIGNVLQQEIRDPRLQFVTITAVKLTEDLKEATVFVSIMGDDKLKTFERLQGAGKFIRACIARRCYLKFLPSLRFKLDSTLEQAARIERLLDSLHLEEQPEAQPEPPGQAPEQ
jgi:ribosome-binding factor A